MTHVRGQTGSTSNSAQYLELLVSWFQTCLITYRGPIATVLHMHIVIIVKMIKKYLQVPKSLELEG